MLTVHESPTSSKSLENVPFDFRGINYEGVRNEFINVFSSFRTLVIAQLTALAFVGKEIFTATDFERSLGLNFVFTLVVLLPTLIGHNWLAQAIYQVSYIFVAYELPALREVVKGSERSDIESRNSLWVLSNRAKSRISNQLLPEPSNVYLGGSDSRNFHVVQVIFALLIIGFATYMSGASWENLLKQPVKEKDFKTILWVINESIMIITVVACIYFWFITRTIIVDATNHWMAYFNERDRCDSEYLSQFNKDFIEKVGLDKYIKEHKPVSNTP